MKELLAWYEKHGRHDLPWRNTDDIYHIYLSEIMLQQTQVERVKNDFYFQFLEKFPTLKTLGNAKLDDVFAAWSGLGYYRRAKNLHASAKICGETLPEDLESLKKLPGIGEYTASAICSFGYNHAVPVIDTNIKRVLQRYFALLDPSDKKIKQYAQQILNTKHPREHNLALMDLGSLICTPTTPACNNCPLSVTCNGKDEPELYTKKKKTNYENLELFLGVCIKQGKIALVPSQDNMYKDMLTLPHVDPVEENHLGSFKHAYTKYRITVKLYKIAKISQKACWIELTALKNAPVSSLVKKGLKFLL